VQRQTDSFEIEDEQGTRYRVYEYVDIPRTGGTGAETESKDEGVRLYQQGNYQQAADQFQRAIATDPRSARVCAMMPLNLGAFSSATARHRSSFRLKCLKIVPSAHPASRAILLVVSRVNPPSSINRCAASRIC